MPNAKSTADKYIQRSGARIDYDEDDFAVDLLTVANFILFHDERNMHGGVRAGEAFEGFCRLINVEPHRLREIARPQSSKR